MSQCVPNTSISGYFSPTFEEGLPDATVGTAYDATIHMHVPTDTVIVITFTVDSIKLLDVEGLPNGVTWACNASDCIMPGGSYGCIQLSGTPNDYGQVGQNDLTAKFMLYLSGAVNQSVSYDVTDYSIELGGAPAAVNDLKAKKLRFTTDQSPASIHSSFAFDLPASGNYSLTVYTLLGAELGTFQSFAQSEMVRVPVKEFIRQPGIYFVTLKQGSYTRSMRVVVQ
jgi:hypothetical protein